MSRVRGRLFAVIGVFVFFGALALANAIPQETRRASPFLPDEGLRLGLDLRGGIHWVLGVKLDAAEQHELEYLADSLETLAADENLTLGAPRVENGRIALSPAGPGDVARVHEFAKEHGGIRVAEESAGSLQLELSDAWRQEVRQRGMLQVLEVLRRRIDDPVTGIPESVVTRQGDDRILVQIPGGELERGLASRILKVTGFLEFKMVTDTAANEELLRAKHPEGLPEDTEIVFERDKETDRVLNAYLVKAKADVTGDYLTDARVQFDRQGRPIVSFTFNAEGGRIFGELTGANVGNQLAIVLDKRVYSAPAIRSQINMHGQIEGRFTPQEAADLSVVLRAGSLSVPVEIEEERTVGPALGADSIARGVEASIAGLVLVLIFALVYYRMSGGYAGIALLVNLVLLVGVMSLFEATLTLPGLAGIVLTVGMAIDANVVIFERIREELRAGKTPRAAINTGFNKALWTILDANITTLITAIVLFEYGTGPIKGFAVTLSLGIVTSVFSAIVVTRLCYALFPGDRPVESLSI